MSRQKVEPSDKNFIEWINGNHLLRNYYLKTLSFDSEDIDNQSFDPVTATNSIIQEYDFIGTTERMEHSAVALQLLLGLSTEDILFLNAKSSGGFDDGADDVSGCTYIVPSFVSKGMRAYFGGNVWKQYTRMDRLLFLAANRSLDLTIERLGRDRFEDALAKYRSAQQQVKEQCASTVVFPCSSSGEKAAHPDCFWADSGCGMGCLDEVSRTLQK